MAINFPYKKSLYTKQAIKDSGILSTEQLEAEYSRLSRLRNARITRLEKNFPNMKIEYERAPKLSSLVDEEGNLKMSQFSSALSETYKFLNKKTTTVTGYRRQVKRSIKSFNKMFDKDIINEDNIQALYDFLEDYRNKYNVQKIPDSDRLLDVYGESLRIGMSGESLLKNIENWESQGKDLSKIYKEMKALQPYTEGEALDSEKYLELLRSKLV